MLYFVMRGGEWKKAIISLDELVDSPDLYTAVLGYGDHVIVVHPLHSRHLALRMGTCQGKESHTFSHWEDIVVSQT